MNQRYNHIIKASAKTESKSDVQVKTKAKKL